MVSISFERYVDRVWRGSRRLLDGVYAVLIQSFSHRTRVNLGSGRRNWRHWICFDEIQDEAVSFFRFSETADLPLPAESVDLVYTSHFLEHVRDAVAKQVVADAFRVLKEDGVLVVKIPDFDNFVASFRKRDEESFIGVGIEQVIHSWPSRGISDSLHNRFAMMFCGFWDDQWGQHYTLSLVSEDRAGFHGPPKLTNRQLEDIVARASGPHAIAARLRKIAENQGASNFNHLNAWGRSEMENLLVKAGFVLMGNDKKTMRKLAFEIPDFHDMESWSAYFIARKTSKEIRS